MEVFTAEAAPDDVPRVTVHTKEELQDALEYLTAAVEASQEAGQGGETSATEATSMSDDAASASRPARTHWVPQGEDAGQEAMQVDDGAPDEINEALNALHLRNVPLIEVDTDNEAECIEPDIEAEPSVIRTDMWIPFPAAGQSFADFARRAHVSSHRWRSAVLATPPVLDADTAEITLPSVDAFQVQASGMTLQELRSKGTNTSRSVDDFLDAPSLSAFNALTQSDGMRRFGRHLPAHRPPICLGSSCVPWWVMATPCLLKLSFSPASPIGYISLCCMRRELPSVLGIAQSRGSPCRYSCQRHCTLAFLPGELFGTSSLGSPCGATIRWDMRRSVHPKS